MAIVKNKKDNKTVFFIYECLKCLWEDCLKLMFSFYLKKLKSDAKTNISKKNSITADARKCWNFFSKTFCDTIRLRSKI